MKKTLQTSTDRKPNNKHHLSLVPKSGRVLPPLLLYFLGVPAGLCIVLWLLFFRG